LWGWGPAAGPHLRVFVICVDPKTFLRVLPTRWRRKPAGVEITSLSPYVLLDTHRRKSYLIGWWRGSVVERRSLAGELSLSCA